MQTCFTLQSEKLLIFRFYNSMRFRRPNANKPKHHQNVSIVNEPFTPHISVGKIAYLSDLTTQCDFDNRTKTNPNTHRTSPSLMVHAHYAFQPAKLPICQICQPNAISTTKRTQSQTQPERHHC